MKNLRTYKLTLPLQMVRVVVSDEVSSDNDVTSCEDYHPLLVDP